MANLLLAGYFGSGNLGDDAILLGFVQGLGSDGHDLNVMSGAPEETYRSYGLRAMDRRNKDQIKQAIDACDALVFPGGSIFQDVTSVASVNYYAGLVSMAKAKKKKIVMLGQGVGPLNNYFGKRAAAAAFNSADVIVVRDPGSAGTLKELGVTRPIKVGADLAFLLPKPTESPDTQGFQVGNMKSVGISIRPFGKTKDLIGLFGEFTRLLYKANMIPVLVEMDRNEDGPLILELSRASGGKIPDLRKIQTPMQLQARLARMDAVIGMRLHSGVLAATVGIPPYMVSYDPKVAAFAKLMELDSAPPLKGLTPTRLFEGFMKFQNERARNVKVLERRREEMIKLAYSNIEILRDVVAPAAKM